MIRRALARKLEMVRRRARDVAAGLAARAEAQATTARDRERQSRGHAAREADAARADDWAARSGGDLEAAVARFAFARGAAERASAAREDAERAAAAARAQVGVRERGLRAAERIHERCRAREEAERSRREQVAADELAATRAIRREGAR